MRSSSTPFRGLAVRNLSLATRSAPSSLLRSTPVLSACKNGAGSTSQEVQDTAQTEMQQYWQKNIGLKRPWSPHLTIYHPPLVMRNSFMHRATVWASAGCAGFWYTGNFDAMLDYVNSYHLGPYVLGSCKFILCYPLVYHYLNGMRHLAWDYAIGFDMKTVNTTGMTVFVLSVLVALGLASIKL
ncbi:unnamed protein product [Dibothriocephalus latus]|uniref:Uncharacterized protein n=1 Tax=Dibothriocephalus latus TaxID=60516 RepID=A0A3P7PQZ8_DIBLA|nr:unnamed protein product [Dibothriocephalus latus]